MFLVLFGRSGRSRRRRGSCFDKGRWCRRLTLNERQTDIADANTLLDIEPRNGYLILTAGVTDKKTAVSKRGKRE